MSFDKVEATLNILKYNSLGYPGTDNGVAATNFHQFSIQNKIRPADPSVFPFEAFRSPANSGHGDFRRVQDICDTQRTALDRCFPDEQCAQCYGDAIDVAVNESATCGAEETRLCAISNTTCFCSGCEVEAEIYYQCILENHACTNVANCTEMTCDEDTLAMDACLTASTTASSDCLSCVVDTVDELFASREAVNCLDYEF